MQPVFTHVPPNRPRSMMATLRPACASRMARNGPDWPVPITIASKDLLITPPSVHGRLYRQQGLRHVGMSENLHKFNFAPEETFPQYRSTLLRLPEGCSSSH